MKIFLAALLCTLLSCSSVGEEQTIEVVKVPKQIVTATSLVDHEISVTAGATAAEIQALLDLNADGDYNLIVNIPAGTYELTRTLYVYPNTTINASEDAKLVKQSRYGAMLETKLIDDDGGYDGNYNITINGGVWDSTPIMDDNQGTETFRFIHSNNIQIKNAKLCNVPEGSHLIVFAGVQNAVVSNCEFYGYANWQTTTVPKEAVQLDTVHSVVQVPTLQEAEITWDDLPCDNITITECEFYDFSRGIGSHTAVAGRLHTNISITNNNFENLSDSAIRLYNYADTTVSENSINKVVEGILVYTYLEDAEADSYFTPNNGVVGTLPTDYNITISDNEITGVKDPAENPVWGDGIRVIGKDDTSARKLSGVEIIDNNISAVSRYGIFATAAPNMVLNSNTISDTTYGGVLLEKNSNNSTITNNTVDTGETYQEGIAIYGTKGVSILKNNVKSVGSAIYLLDVSDSYVGKDSTTGNTVESVKENGIHLSRNGETGTGCKSISVIGNTVKSAQDGICAHQSVSSTISSNKILSAVKNGISVEAGSNSSKITSNVITKAGIHGISVTSSTKMSVTSNTISAYSTIVQDGNGIYAFQSGGTSSTYSGIGKNKITGKGTLTGRHAIKISNCSYTSVYSNTITKADGAGIYVLESTNCKIGASSTTGNKITTTTAQGIYVTTTCTSAQVLYNTISGTKSDGIAVVGSTKTTITGNSVSAGANGISVTGKSDSGKVTSNTITKASKDGIYVTSSKSLSISSNTITATANGISIGSTSNSPTVTSNTIVKAGKCGISITSSTVPTVKSNTIKAYATRSKDGSGIYLYKSGGTSASKMGSIASNKITGTGKLTGRHAIKMSNCPYISIYSNTITKADGSGIYVLQSANCKIGKDTKTGNKITTTTEHGIYITTTCTSTQVLYNTVSGIKKDGIAVVGSTKTTIKGNSVSAGANGISVTGKSDSAKVTSNTITKAPKDGIYVTSSKSVSISSNTITATGNGISIGSTSSTPTVTSNTIVKAGKCGISITSSTRPTIKNNTIKAYSSIAKDGNGIYLYQSAGTSTSKMSDISGNKITGTGKLTGRHAIKMSNCPYTSVYSNTITKADGAGIYVLSSANCKIGTSTKTGNKITTTKAQGIYLTSSCTGTQVLYNTITGTAKEGIAGVTKCTKLTITGNKISAGTYGISVTGSCTSTKVSNNTISKAGKDGIYVTSSKSMTISGNTITATGNGISIGSASNSPTVTSNTIVKAGKCGISITSSTGINVLKNIIKAYASSMSDGSAIYVYKAGGTSKTKCSKITSNTITGSGTSTKKYGIKVSESSYMTIESNTLNSIPGTAIYVYKTKYCTTNKNTIKTPRAKGIYYTTSCDGGKITSNTITKPADAAINIYKAPSTTITSNKIIVKSKTLKGIWISNSNKSSVKTNTISGTTKKNAVVITSSSSCTNSKNTIK